MILLLDLNAFAQMDIQGCTAISTLMIARLILASITPPALIKLLITLVSAWKVLMAKTVQLTLTFVLLNLASMVAFALTIRNRSIVLVLKDTMGHIVSCLPIHALATHVLMVVCVLK